MQELNDDEIRFRLGLLEMLFPYAAHSLMINGFSPIGVDSAICVWFGLPPSERGFRKIQRQIRLLGIESIHPHSYYALHFEDRKASVEPLLAKAKELNDARSS